MNRLLHLLRWCIWLTPVVSLSSIAYEQEYSVRIQTSVYTTHFDPKPEHNNSQNLVGFELLGDYWDWQDFQLSTPWLGKAYPFAGAANFQNSFGQSTSYAFVGVRQDHVRLGPLQSYSKISAGLLHGYEGDYRNNVPFNQLGMSPAIVPMVGLEYQRFAAELTLFGTAGLMVTVGLSF